MRSQYENTKTASVTHSTDPRNGMEYGAGVGHKAGIYAGLETENILPLPGFEARTVQSVLQSLYRLRYPGSRVCNFLLNYYLDKNYFRQRM
jgi:hypothetical protein